MPGCLEPPNRPSSCGTAGLGCVSDRCAAGNPDPAVLRGRDRGGRSPALRPVGLPFLCWNDAGSRPKPARKALQTVRKV